MSPKKNEQTNHEQNLYEESSNGSISHSPDICMRNITLQPFRILPDGAIVVEHGGILVWHTALMCSW
jgi:hypothetical protein